MATEAHFDVAVVGGGLVGRLYVWRALAAGARVLWLASQPPAGFGLHPLPAANTTADAPAAGARVGAPVNAPADARGIALSAASLQTLVRLGVALAVEPGFNAIERIEVSRAGSAGRAWLGGESDADAATRGATNPVLGAVIPLVAIEAEIDARIVALANTSEGSRLRVEALPQRVVSGFPGSASGDGGQGLPASGAGALHVALPQTDEARVCLTLLRAASDPEARADRKRPDVRQDVQVDLLVAADGAGSTLRELAGIEVDRRDFGSDALVFDVETTRAHRGRAFERFSDHGPLALLPVGRRRMNVVWARPRGSNLQQSGEAEAIAAGAALQAAFGWTLGRLTPLNRPQRFPLLRVRARSGFRRRVLLAGNAWHALHPVAGQGLNLTLRDLAAMDAVLTRLARPACVASPVPPHASDHRVSADWGAAAAWAEFDRARDADIRRTVGLTDALASGFVRRGDGGRSLLAGSLGWAMSGLWGPGLWGLDRLAPLKRRFVQQTGGRSAQGAGAKTLTGATGDHP